MASAPDRHLLVELLVEELPPKALDLLGREFAQGIWNGLVRHQLQARVPGLQTYATPRRLAVLVPEVLERAPDRSEMAKVMPASVAFDANGKATTALSKRLAALGADATSVTRLQRRVQGKVEQLFLERSLKGANLADAMQTILDQVLASLPIPKIMQYQLADGWTSVSFVRPAHGLVALHGDAVVPVRALGLDAGRTTRGHRFEGSRAPIVLRDATSYATQLRGEGAAIANFDERRDEIRRQLDAAAAAAHLAPVDDAELLDEVTALVELPNVLTCEFEREFLAVPQECLVLTMKANQRYFPLLEQDGRLTNRFLVVSNVAPADPARIVEGNERVVRPRLADAKFFYDQDRKRPLESRIPALDKVVYHGKLGSQGDRVRRVRQIATSIVELLGVTDLGTKVDRAALLAKADLTTDMVGEFPELQGVMGRYYALHDGEQQDVAFAIEDHYRPRFAGDELPRNDVGVVVALADKLETLVGLFGVGQVPTGDKDPYALRRHALGIVRLLIERKLNVGLLALVDLATKAMPPNAQGDWLLPLEFAKDRAKGYFEEQGFDRRAVDSVLGPHGALFPLGQLPEVVREAAKFIATPEGQLLAEANKRITNILKKSGEEVPFGMSPRDLKDSPVVSAFQQDEERALFAALLTAGESALMRREDRQYAQALALLIPLSEPIKAFFDKVMVNVPDEHIRHNRITLLKHARAYMNQVADLTLMAG